jgi:hypothetical protein
MPDVLTCPSCQRKLQVPETLMGQEVQCPTCGATFRAQGVGFTSPGPLPPRFDEPAPAPSPSPSPSRALVLSDQRDRDDEDDRDDDDYRGRSRVRRRRRHDYEPHRSGLILGLGIASLCVIALGGIGVVIGLVLGPIAWTMGSADLAAIRAGRMDPEGESQTSTGRMCGMIATIVHGVLVLLTLVFCFVYIVFIAAVVGTAGSKK